LKRGSPRDSLARYEEALQIAGTVSELSRLVRIYHGLARCNMMLGDHNRAIDLAEKAVNLAVVEHDLSPAAARTTLPRVENDLGMMLMAGGQLDRAESLFRSALSHFAEAGLERTSGHVMLSLSELRQRQGNLDEAFELAREAVHLAQRLGETLAIVSGYQQLGELHAERGEHDRVDACFLEALALLERAGLDRRAAECRTRHEAARRAPDQRTSAASAAS
jgi:tetratricopeptide (TPR) repeat protein